MSDTTWADTMQAAITVSDHNGQIIYMNEASQQLFEREGGNKLIGKSLYDCHSPASVELIHQIMEQGNNHIYTVQKLGKHKMVLQAPYTRDGEVAGLVEISFEIPVELPHHNRD